MASLLRLPSPAAFQDRFFFLAKRFVAGEGTRDALAAVRAMNAAGMSATLDFLGENVRTAAEARRTRDAYLDLFDAIEREGARVNVSVKLTALGLEVDPELCFGLVCEIAARAAGLADPFVRIDMEGSAHTAATLAMAERVFARHRNVGPVIQAYLLRSPLDVERAIALGQRVRLCKGAYDEPEDVALRSMPAIRRAYLRMAEALLSRGVYPGIATHDERIVDAVRAYAAEFGIAPERFEFQLLYGVRPDLQRELVRLGHNVRIYVPYGTHWAGYFYRRVTERKENALFALRSLVSR